MFSLSGSFVPPAEAPACDPEHIDSGGRASTDSVGSLALWFLPLILLNGGAASPLPMPSTLEGLRLSWGSSIGSSESGVLVQGEQQLHEITGGTGMKALSMAYTNRKILSRNITLLSGLEQPGPCRTHQCHHCELGGNK